MLSSAWVEIWWQIVVHYNNGVRRPSSVILKYHQAFYQVPIHSSLFQHLLLYLVGIILNQDDQSIIFLTFSVMVLHAMTASVTPFSHN